MDATSSPAPQASERVVTAADLEPVFKQELLKRIQSNEGEMKIKRFQVFPSQVSVPEGKLDIEMDASPGQRPVGMFTCVFTIKVDGKVEHRVRGCGFVELYRPVVCVARAFPSGHVLEKNDLDLIRQPVSRLGYNFFDSMSKVIGMAVKYPVRPGQVLTSRMVAPPLVAHRGDFVTITADSPFFTITTPGELQQDGSLGETVKVKNMMSKRQVIGVLVDSKTVAVRFDK